jgi:hypothetical protein
MTQVKFGELFLLVAGLGQLVLGIGHVGLHKILNWQHELQHANEMTKAVSYTHTFYVGLTTFGLGLLDASSAHRLVHDRYFGRLLLAFAFIFWFLRLIAQLTIYRSPTHSLPRGRFMQHLGIAAWTTLTVVHLFALILNLRS